MAAPSGIQESVEKHLQMLGNGVKQTWLFLLRLGRDGEKS